MSTEATYTPDERFAGTGHIETTEVTVASGQNLAELTPVGLLASSGEAVEWDPAGTGGAEIAVYVTNYAVDASAAAKTAQVFKAAPLNIAALNWPDGTTAAQKANAFKGTPISVQAKV